MIDDALVTVTGAGGFVGNEVVRRLREVTQVRAIVRGRALPPALSGGRVQELRVDDLARPDALESACSGAQTVIHLAARVHQIGEARAGAERRYVEQNVELTRSLAEAAARSGARRFVFLSSIKAVAERSPGRPLSVDDAAHPEDAYGRSKLSAERALADIAAATGLEVAIIRAPLVYGPQVGANFRQLVRWVARGIPLPLGSIANRRSMISVWNLADLISVACVHPRASGGTFHVADARPISTPELVSRVAEALRRPSPLFPCPPSLLSAALRGLGRGALIDRLLGSLEVDTRVTTTRLGWSPPLSIEDGLRRAVQEMSL